MARQQMRWIDHFDSVVGDSPQCRAGVQSRQLPRLLRSVVVIALWMLMFPHSVHAVCLDPPGDVTYEGTSNVQDVQCLILMNLWSIAGQTDAVPVCLKTPGSPSVVADHNCDGVVNVADTLLAVQFALVLALDEIIDKNGNQCVDACETDADSDGDFDFSDCAPYQPGIFTGAPELCNGTDDNCDSKIDEGTAPTVVPSCSDSDFCTGTETCKTFVSQGIVISEIMVDPASVTDSAGEWIELFNTTAVPVNITGWTLTDNAGETHVIQPGGALFVPAGGTLLLGTHKDPLVNGGLRIAYAYSGFTLDNNADAVVVLDKNQVEIDRVEYNLATNFPIVTGASMALVDPALNNNSAASWKTSTATSVTGDLGTPLGPNLDVANTTCLPGTPLVCTDLNPCTDNFCVPETGCVTANNSDGCDDNNVCTTVDGCDTGECVGSVPLVCNDDNGCTDDGCDPALGCVFVSNTSPCDDLDPCTVTDLCESGQCVGSGELQCDDGELCTDDSCVVGTGCEFSANLAPCDDGDVCTTNDQCENGFCVGGAALDCNAGNPCGGLICDPLMGCIGTPDPVGCDDGNPCTQDTCDADLGCVSVPVLTDPDCLPPDVLCGISGSQGDVKVCPLYLARATIGTPLPTAAQFRVNYDNLLLTLDEFTDAICTGPAGTPPCVTAPVPPASLSPSGHTVSLVPDDPADWSGTAMVFIYHPSDTTTSISDAFLLSGQVIGNAEILSVRFVLTTDIPEDTPTWITLADVFGATANGSLLTGTVDASLMILESTGCAGNSALCDDGNPCTIDSCHISTQTCVHAPYPCDDGNDCNGVETCTPGVGCSSPAPLACDDGNVCTADGCVPGQGCVSGPINTPECLPDGVVCAIAGTVGTTITCPIGAARVTSGTPNFVGLQFFAQYDATRADWLGLTDTVCFGPGGTLPCADVNTPPAPLSSGHILFPIPNNFDQWAGLGSIFVLDPTQTDNPVTTAYVDAGLLNGDPVFTTVTLQLTADVEAFDPVLITLSDTYGTTKDGALMVGSVVDSLILLGLPDCGVDGSICDDGLSCTVDLCNPTSGQCVYTPVDCADGDACNGVELCQEPSGDCAPGVTPDCDDQDPCTLDVCSPDSGCAHVPTSVTECQPDGVLCTISGSAGSEVTCPIRVARATQAMPIPVGLQANFIYDSAILTPTGFSDQGFPTPPAILSPSGHQVYPLPADPSLWSGDGWLFVLDLAGSAVPLTTAYRSAGAIVGDAEIMEITFILMTDVDPNSPTFIQIPESFGTTEQAVIMTGVVEQGTIILSASGCHIQNDDFCNDNNACTTDSCDPDSGLCVFSPFLCDNNNPCDGIETCSPIDGCTAGTVVDCDDSDPCTLDGCDPVSGLCVHDPNGCNDNNPCNGIETCSGVAECTAGIPLACQDNNECTLDSCDPVTGCVYTPVLTAACLPDGVLCGLVGKAGDTVSCTLRVVRETENTPLPASLQVGVSYNPFATLLGAITDTLCLGPGGTEPCFTASTPPNALSTSHGVFTVPDSSPMTWGGQGTLFLVSLSEPTAPLTTAFLDPVGQLIGDADVLTLQFLLLGSIPETQPQWVLLTNPLAATGGGSLLSAKTHDATVIVSEWTCVDDLSLCDDDNLCTIDTCDPLAKNCQNTPMSCNDDNVCTTDSCDPSGQCVNAPIVSESCLPPMALCVVSGNAGDQVVCAIDLARHESVLSIPTGLQLQLSYDAQLLSFVEFQGNVCIGPGGTPPCGTGTVPPSPTSSGHIAVLVPDDLSTWDGQGVLFLVNTQDPGAPLSEATVTTTGVVTGDPHVLDIVVQLLVDIDENAPAVIQVDLWWATSATAELLNGAVDSGLLVVGDLN